MESVLLTTSDGPELAADLLRSSVERRGSVVVCHPHPQYGGDRFNPVVDAVFRHLPTLGFDALRFDFRSDFGGGVAERHDVVAALDEIERRSAGPVFVVGYSFGASVALNTSDDRVRGVVAIAPPLSMMPVTPPTAPTLVLTPRHDQFSPPETAQPIVADWAGSRFRVVESADHFLVGRAEHVAEMVADWLGDRVDPMLRREESDGAV